MISIQAKDVKILPLTIDGVFKMYFEEPSNLPQLRSFLLAHVEIDEDDLTEIQIINPGLPKMRIDDKGFTVDLMLKTMSGNDIHIEMQTGKEPHFKERVQLYNARAAGSQLKIGQKYHETKRTISLIVVDFNLFGDYNRYHEKIFMCRDNGEIFTEAQEINIVNLKRVEESQCKSQYLWGKLLKVETVEELEMIANESEEMKDAAEKLLAVSADERAQAYALSQWNHEFKMHNRKLYEQQQREKNLTEGHEKGHEKGLEQGLEQGLELKTIEIAKAMIADNLPLETISKYTGLAIDEIKALVTEL